MNSAPLFATASDDLLNFGRGEQFDPKKVVDWMKFDRKAVSIMSSVSPHSVRYDEDIPRAVKERLEDVANLANMVAGIFDGDVDKTLLWFKTANPMLGNISPRDMVRMGRDDRLRKFIVGAIADNEDGQRVVAKNEASQAMA